MIRVIRCDARDLPIEDGSVDLIVTSPPYFGLRSYQDGGEHYEGQVGAEPTPAEFVDALIDCTREMVRVLKPTGSLWINLGDKYNSAASGQNGSGGGLENSSGYRRMQRGSSVQNVRPKSLIGIPWRYALRCIDDLGLILRAEVIWSKPNGLPESVTDRVRRSHEQWFHFVVSPRYYSAVDEIREPHAGEFLADGVTRNPRHKYGGIMPNEAGGKSSTSTPDRWSAATGLNPLGKLPGSVWTIATEPLRVPPELGIDHFAAFPSEWPRRLVLGWSPREVCSACGEGRRPVSERTLTANRKGRQSQRDMGTPIGGGDGTQTLGWERVVTITGFACACSTGSYEWMSPGGVPHLVIRGLCATCGNGPHPLPSATPGVVLDPFGGTGTTAHVASALGRRGVSVDLSADYCRLAAHPYLIEKRAAKVQGAKPAKKKPPAEPADAPPRFVDEPLFDLGDGEAA